ncbi:MAG: hypothetical protein WDN23_05550 [Edaphobacter sp.]
MSEQTELVKRKDRGPKIELSVRAILLTAVIVWAIPVGIYATRFHPLTPGDAAAAWGSFGTFLNGTIGPLLAIINLGLVAHIALNIQKGARNREEKNQKAKLLFDLYQTWNSSMYVARIEADQFLQAHPDVLLIDIHRSPESKPIWEVLGFFDMVQFAIDQGLIDAEETVDLLGRVFVWWQIVCIKTEYPQSWDPGQRINRFHDLVKKAPAKIDKTTYEGWVNDANIDLAERQAAKRNGRQRLRLNAIRSHNFRGRI